MNMNKKENNTMNKVEMNDEMMEQVSGGVWWSFLCPYVAEKYNNYKFHKDNPGTVVTSA